jgi:hypothetical protein
MTGHARDYDLVTLEDSERPPKPVDYRSHHAREPTCPDYSDAEIGAMVRMALDGMTAWQIEMELGITGHEIGGMLRGIADRLPKRALKGKARPGRKGL